MISNQSSLWRLLTAWSLVAAVCSTLVKPRIYEIRNVNSSCSSQEMKIRLELNRHFHGIVYAKGFPLEKSCRATGTGETFVDISIDTSECGVRLVSIDDEMLTFKVSLNVQMDKLLQQITDLEVSTACNLSLNDVSNLKRGAFSRQVSRRGRTKPSDLASQKENNSLNQIKTWMEIEGTSDVSSVNKVAVGEQTMMLIKSFLPEETDANVVDCYAYDGTRDVVQKLLDESGCPLDESIMPPLERVTYESESEGLENDLSQALKQEFEKFQRDKGRDTGNESREVPGTEKTRLQVMGTMFSAFKFPDTSNLHLRCTLQICKQMCPPISCDSGSEFPNERVGKSIKTKKNSSSIIEKIEVFNSVEVLAPGIDADGYPSDRDDSETKLNLEESSFCLSASKMAFSFAILGAVFLCGVLAALWTVMRNHMRKANKVDGSEQILVVRDSPLNFTNTRNKAFRNWTYS